ncbi:protein AF-9 isoform X2 [Condylostylus longicornis]|nr:protein AF-9 isoform X2 [Condylostylus longicornis]
MSIRVQFEIGHKAVLKTRKAENRFTHDWELYVKGVDKADISSYIEKIVFNLHESFPKPKRTFKEPPYVLKESGYAGFILPIDIHFKNKTMQTYQYDIDLQPSGPPVHKSEIKKHIFENPSEDFRQKLLRGGGVLLGNTDEERNRHTESEFQHKPKNLSSSNIAQDSLKKSHKIRQEKSKVQNFENIFGKPITKTTVTPNPTSNPNITSLKSSSSSQEQKVKSVNTSTAQSSSTSRVSSQSKPDKIVSNLSNSNSKEKIEVSDKVERKEKHKHGSHKDKEKINKEGKDKKDEKHEKREDRERKKDKSHSKERDRSNEKSSKTRTESPQRKKPRTQSPVVGANNIPRKSPSWSSTTGKDENKSKTSLQALPTSFPIQPQPHHQNTNQSQTNDSDKKTNSSSSKKSKKEKKSHDKDKERDSRKERENKAQKETEQSSRTSSATNYQATSSTPSVGSATSSNTELNKTHKLDSGSIKPPSKSKAEQKVMTETLNYFSNSNTTNSTSITKKVTDKHESEEKRHKHKKKEKSKDKDKEKSRDKEASSLKEKDKKREKKFNKEDFKRNKDEDVGSNATSSSNLGPTESLHDSLFNSDHESRYSDTDKVTHHSDNSSHSFVGKLNKNKTFQNNASTTVHKPFSSALPVLPPSSNETVTSSAEKKDKKNKDQKVEKEEKKRKRKSREGADIKVSSTASSNNIESQPKVSKKSVVDSKKYEKPVSSLTQHQPHAVQTSDSFRAPSVSSSSSISNSSVPNVQHHNPISRTNINSGNISNSGFDLDYISELKELQEKIMTLQDNNELQKVVEIIAATGRFEITNKTFDFDLCALDRNTIQRLHVIV